MAEINLNFNLHPTQFEVFEEWRGGRRFVVVVAGRRYGKTHLAVILMLIHALQDKDEKGRDIHDAEIWYVAPTYAMAKSIVWKKLKLLGKDVIESTLENELTAKLINGREIKLKGADKPDTLRGNFVSLVVLDEYATMKPEAWDLSIAPSLTDVEGRAFFIGSPAGKNHFYDLWLKGVPTADRDEEWASFSFTTSDNPYLPKGEVEKARKRMSSDAFRQEYEGSFEAAGGGTFKREWFQYADCPKEPGRIYITYDPAGYSSGDGKVKSAFKKLDEHAISVVEVGPSGWFVHDIIHGRWDIREASLQLIRAAQKWHPSAVGIEKGSLKNAIMPYLEDQMRRLNIYPSIRELTHGGQQKEARITWALQGRMEHGRIWFKRGAPWLRDIEDQFLDFPNPMSHDDLIDSLAYVDQISTVSYLDELVVDDFEPLDDISGW